MSAGSGGDLRIAAIIPCYRVGLGVLDVLDGLNRHVDAIFVVDDACPEGIGDRIRSHRDDVTVLTHAINGGVGAATITGYRAALAGGFDLLVKIDGDGQMLPIDVPALLAPLRAGVADYAKGDRLSHPAGLRAMPPLRRLGNRLFARIARHLTGIATLSDPMNGFTAITAATLARLPLDQLDRRWFFEADMLIHLARLRARIVDVPMPARYGTERSNLRIMDILLGFPPKIAASYLRHNEKGRRPSRRRPPVRR